MPIPVQKLIYIVDISGMEMQLMDVVTIDTGYGLYRFDVNDDYFIYVNGGEIDAQVLLRETMVPITTSEAGGFFKVKENYLFRGMTNGYLSILDISNIYNQIEISSVYIGECEQNMIYYFHDDYLFIGQNGRIAIIDISDIENPQLVSNITNIPSTPAINHFTDIIVYGDILVFKNMGTMLWLYDISDIYNPVYISLNTTYSSATSFKESMLIFDNYLYLSCVQTNIMQFDAEQLPNLEFIGEYGNYGKYHFFDFRDPYLFLNDPYNNVFMYFNVYEENPVIDTLFSSTFTYCFNDSLLCFLNYTSSSNTELVVCSYDSEEITIENSTYLGNAYYDMKFVGEHLILTQKDTGIVEIYDVEADYSIDILTTHNVERSPFVPRQTSQCSDDYIYIKSKNYEDGIYYLDIFENFGSFNNVASYNLNLFGNNFVNMFRLSDNKTILFEYQYPGSEAYLCDYFFPDEFVYTDIFNTTGDFRLHDDFLVWSEGYKTVTKLYSWQNDEFEEIFSYDFGCEISDIFIIPNTNTLYGVGRYTIVKYSFDYSDVEDYELPVSNNYQLTNYPNPFTGETTISFSLATNLHEKAEIEIYNVKGQIVDQLAITNYELGSNQVNYSADKLSSGVYFYKLIVDGKAVDTKKMVLVK